MGERLGSGGQATVYGGTWLGTPVAIKVLPDSEGFDLSAASMEQVEEYNAIKYVDVFSDVVNCLLTIFLEEKNLFCFLL